MKYNKMVLHKQEEKEFENKSQKKFIMQKAVEYFGY